MVEFNTYLFLDGRCEEAFTAYERIMGGKIVMMLRHADTPMAEKVAPDWQDKIAHACLEFGGRRLMGSDAQPGCVSAPAGFATHVATAFTDEAERIFAALAEAGEVRHPLGSTFWAERFGMLVDRFGVPWMVEYRGSPAAAPEVGA